MDWSILHHTSLQLLRGIPTLLTVGVVLLAARFWFVRASGFRPRHDLVDAENTAVGVALGGYLLGISIAMLGAISMRSDDHTLVVMGKLLAEGLVVVVLMQCALWTNDRVILRRFSIQQEICHDMNLGAGLCVAGSCIACGVILNGASTGLSVNWWFGLLDICIYWLVGQITLVAGASVYARLAQYDVHDLIEHDDNVAVGIAFSSWLVCLGLVVRASIIHAGSAPLASELMRTGLIACVGISCLLAVQTLTIRLFAAWVPSDDEIELHGNIALSTAAACAMLAMTLVFTSIIQR